MNDDELPINAELASAYLDGELDAAERASAAADPDVMAMVDSFARVRAALSAADPVVESTRTAAMAAALAEFDAQRADAALPVAAAATVTSLHSRRMRAYRVISGVAAAAVVGVIAVAALNSSDSKDQATSAAVEATAAPAEDRTSELPSLKVAADTGGAPAGTFAPASADAAATESAAAIPVIDNADGLARYAADFDSHQAPALASPAPPSPSTMAPAGGTTGGAGTDSSLPCLSSDQVVIGPITFQGKSAYAVRLNSTGAVQAIDAINCRVFVEVAAP